MTPHLLNWYVGWGMVLAAFLSGAAIGLFFHRDDFLGGYTSFRRRIVRLGHIALAALGMLNVLYGLSPWPAESRPEAGEAGLCLIVGGLTMPLVCFLTGWKGIFRHLFLLPVTALVLGVILVLRGGPP
jgi:hypothetical protein